MKETKPTAQQEIAKITANLLLNVKDVKWLVNLNEKKTTSLISYLVLGIEQKVLPASLAKMVLTKYIEMRKHDRSDNPPG